MNEVLIIDDDSTTMFRIASVIAEAGFVSAQTALEGLRANASIDSTYRMLCGFQVSEVLLPNSPHPIQHEDVLCEYLLLMFSPVLVD